MKYRRCAISCDNLRPTEQNNRFELCETNSSVTFLWINIRFDVEQTLLSTYSPALSRVSQIRYEQVELGLKFEHAREVIISEEDTQLTLSNLPKL